MWALKIAIFLVAALAAAVNVKMGLDRKDAKGKDHPDAGRVGLSVLALLLTILVVLPAFGEVPSGHRGVVTQFGKVTGTELDEGLYFVLPFVTHVELMDVQTHAINVAAPAASRDLQDVSATVTVSTYLIPGRTPRVFQELRRDYDARIVRPAVQEAVKAATAHFDAERLIVERPQVKWHIEEALRARLEKHGIGLDGVAITNFSFGHDFTKAIEQKVTSLQLALKANNDLAIAKAESENKLTRARADAEAIRIKAQAISSQGGRDYVALMWIDAWRAGGSKVPTMVMGGDKGSSFLMQLPLDRVADR